ncbi:hypothetical protein R1flu_021805 [Riccia fluitans]|uniref:RING-type E3 ubiquitin transferase n=1 Tax=Riccia fluitans TaxID=41844 RepID=A0ABD1ZRK7_9MARC
MGGSRILGEVVAEMSQTFNVLATGTNNGTGTAPPDPYTANDITARFNPSMAIIIIVLISAFLFMGFFSIYVRRCTTAGADHAAANGQQNNRPANSNENRPGQGLDRAVVETLPLVGYSLVKGLKGGKDLSECAVCLSEFEEDEVLRLLPKCGHLFHPECIDMWFFSHSTCPLCRSSLIPPPNDKDANVPPDIFGNWGQVDSHGNVSDNVAITIHDGPPVPPNGSILELLSRENADRLLTESLRRDGAVERMDAGLARREEDVGGDRAIELRVLNRALSRNSTSFRKAVRGIEVTERIGAVAASASESARFHPSTVAGAVNGAGASYVDKRGRNTRSVGSSQSFNLMMLRRSSSMGSSGRYIRQLFGNNYADHFSPETAGEQLRIDRAKLLGEHRLPAKGSAKIRRGKSEDELNNLFFNELQNLSYADDNSHQGSSVPRSGELWDNVDLENNVNRANPHEQSSVNSELSIDKSGELVPGGRTGEARVKLQLEASGPLYVRRKGGNNGSSSIVTPAGTADNGTRSDRWNFSIRRTFSLRRTFSDSRNPLDGVGALQTENSSSGTKWWQIGSSTSSSSSSSRPKKSSPWAAAMKDRRHSADHTGSTPFSNPSPGSIFSPYALSLPSPGVNHRSSFQSSNLPSPAVTASTISSHLPSPVMSQTHPDRSQEQSQRQQPQVVQAAADSQVQNHYHEVVAVNLE